MVDHHLASLKVDLNKTEEEDEEEEDVQNLLLQEKDTSNRSLRKSG